MFAPFNAIPGRLTMTKLAGNKLKRCPKTPSPLSAALSLNDLKRFAGDDSMSMMNK